jgi:5-methylcytosine-specific restriction protein B
VAEYTLTQLVQESGYTEEQCTQWLQALNRKQQAVLYGPPGTGKTYLAQKLAQHLVGGGDGFIELVQFHPAYDYTDFMEGIRPQSDEGQLTYALQNGRFLTFCEQARGRKDICVLIIDELNRANVARVFGELMYLLEYRDQQIPLANGTPFSIPENVYLVATMNTADRSIALVDHALRRRFAFIPIWPNSDLLRHYHKQTGLIIEPLLELLEQLNRHIDDPHYAIGVSFFMRPDLDTALEAIWKFEIEPYLEEYFFSQSGRVAEYRWAKIAERLRPLTG